MRFYHINIIPTSNGVPSGLPQVYTTISPLGLYGNSSALQVELDIMQAPQHKPQQMGLLKIKGVSYEDISTAANLNGAIIQIFLGMSLGLPLSSAQPQPPRLVIDGVVLQAFGNWQGTDVSLDLIVGPPSYGNNVQNPANIIFNWLPDQPMAEAIELALSDAYPIAPIFTKISPNLVNTRFVNSCTAYPDLTSFAKMLRRVSLDINPVPFYQGVQINFSAVGIDVYDGTVASRNLTILNWSDLIGSITYISNNEISIKVVMRGDINLGGYIQVPMGSPLLLVPSTNPENFYKNLVPWMGVYIVGEVHHMGHSRQSDANSWVTVLKCFIPKEQAIPSDIKTIIRAVGNY